VDSPLRHRINSIRQRAGRHRDAPTCGRRGRLLAASGQAGLSLEARPRLGYPLALRDRLEVKSEITGANGGPIAIDLQAVLLNPANLERLDEAEVAVLRSAIAKLMAPAPQVVDVAAEPVEAEPDANG
jgi:hypothetical protein